MTRQSTASLTSWGRCSSDKWQFALQLLPSRDENECLNENNWHAFSLKKKKGCFRLFMWRGEAGRPGAAIQERASQYWLLRQVSHAGSDSTKKNTPKKNGTALNTPNNLDANSCLPPEKHQAAKTLFGSEPWTKSLSVLRACVCVAVFVEHTVCHWSWQFLCHSLCWLVLCISTLWAKF